MCLMVMAEVQKGQHHYRSTLQTSDCVISSNIPLELGKGNHIAKLVVKGRELNCLLYQEIQSYVAKGTVIRWGKELRLIIQFAVVASVRIVSVEWRWRKPDFDELKWQECNQVEA